MRRERIFFSLFLPLIVVVGLGAYLEAPLAGGVAWSLLAGGAIAAWVMFRLRWREEEYAQRFRVYFERAMVGMAVSAPDKKWQEVNPALCAILGYSAEELLGKSWDELTFPADLAANNAQFERVMRGEINGYELEKRYIRADGRIITALVSVQAVRKADGRVDSMLIVVEDITARLAAECALRASEELVRNLGDNLPDSYVFQYAKRPGELMYFVYVSSGVRQIHGCEPEDVLDDPGLLPGLLDPAQLPELDAATVESARTLADFSMELRVRLAAGEWGWLQVRSRPRCLASGEIVWDGVATDITARRQSDAMLDLQARRAAVLLDLPRQSSLLGERQFMQYALQQMEAITESKISFMHFVNDDGEGVELEAWSAGTLEKYCTAAYDSHYPLGRAGIWADAIRQKRPVVINDFSTADQKCGLPAGHSTLDRLVSLPVLEDGQVRMVTGVGNKEVPYGELDIESIQLISNETWRIVSQRRTERALKIATQVVNASQVICFRWRAEAGWPAVFVSDNVVQWGYSVAGMLAGQPPFSELVHPDDLARVQNEVAGYLAEGRTTFSQDYRLLTADRQVIWVVARTSVQLDAAGQAEFFDGVVNDITRRKRQEQELASNLAEQKVLNKRLEEAHNQLLQSEKMASIGQLAAGIAHELNNPIGFVHSNLGTLESYLRDLMEIVDAYEQAAIGNGEVSPQQAAIVRLKEDRDFNFMRQDIVQLMAESKDGLSRVRKIVQDLKSFSHVSEQEWQWADLYQGLDSTLNIVWNELKYKCTVVKEYGDLPKVYCMISQLNQVFMNLLVNAGHAIEKQGVITLRTSRHGDGEVCIEVADTGKGIAPEHISRIFEPFFTTKPVGKGTGLGLSLSYGIVDRHHGRIEVASTPGVGSTFRVILPIQPETGESDGNNTETPA